MSYDRKEYVISFALDKESNWQDIDGMSMQFAMLLDKYIQDMFPLGSNEIKEICALLNQEIGTEERVFGIDFLGQNNIEGEIMIVEIKVEEKKIDKRKNINKQVWEFVMEIGLDTSQEKEFNRLIKKNLDRIQFVKDGIGLRDFLFLVSEGCMMAERDGEGFLDSASLALDSDVEPTDSFEEKFKKSRESIETRSLVILNQLKDFFENTNRTLYVGIGFTENLIPIEDPIEIQNLYMEMVREGKSEHECLRLKRRFPKWYNGIAKLPEELTFMTHQTEKYFKEYLDEKELNILKEELVRMGKLKTAEQLEKL